jgi:hypothetical protein
MRKAQCSVSTELRVIEALRTSLVPMVSFDDWFAYANFDIDPDRYNSREAFIRDYTYVSFLRKWKGLKDKRINPEWTAFSSWLDAEKLCFRTNRRLESEASTGIYSVAPSTIIGAQRKIAQILGRLDYDRIAELCRFGGGATTDLKRGSSHAKKSLRPSITFDAIPAACRVLARDDYLGSLVGPFKTLKVLEANRMVMVPKTVKTHRPIAAEPTLNSFIQQGIGRYIREKLQRFGVNLNDQTINQVYASKAQDSGFSTIDLSSASDTLCTNLVKLLLPREWYELLDSVRCKKTRYKGKTFVLSKFSSMGNAFTFELESMIFYALVSEVCTGGVSSVYGDDIVVKDSDYQHTLEILTWAGFKINELKSYTAGSHFYESCGKHYFDGAEVTPCYQKDVCSQPHDYVRLHNRLVRASVRLNLRSEFKVAIQLVRDDCRVRYGKRCPGVGPLVEYDEYYIKEDFVWTDPLADRIQILSAVTVPVIHRRGSFGYHVAYLGRKLRCPSFQSPDPQGQVAETKGSKLLVYKKYHWRSAGVSP